MTLVGHT